MRAKYGQIFSVFGICCVFFLYIAYILHILHVCCICSVYFIYFHIYFIYNILHIFDIFNIFCIYWIYFLYARRISSVTQHVFLLFIFPPPRRLKLRRAVKQLIFTLASWFLLSRLINVKHLLYWCLSLALRVYVGLKNTITRS